MPFDDRKRWKEALEVNAREARRSRPEAEDTDPPPAPDPSWPPAPVLRPGHGSPSATIVDPPPHVKRLGNWGKYIASMVAGGTALYAVGHPVITWITTRVAAEDVAIVKRGCDLAAAASATAAVVPIQQRIEELEKKEKRHGQRWDALDKWHRQQFQRRNAPPVPQFGPKAESRGNAATVEDFDSP